MIRYSENPNLDKKVITKFDGTKEYRTNCWKIKGEYYTIGLDAFEIDGLKYRLSSGLIAFDHETQKMVVKQNTPLKQGIVGFKNGQPIVGMFQENPYKNVKCFISERTYTVLNSEILILNKFIEDVSTGIWYPIKDVSVSDCQTPKNKVNHQNQGYNIEDNEKEMRHKIELYNKFNPELTKDVKRYAKMLGDITFGLELECSKGFLPEHLQNQLGVVICRDGSLKDENGLNGPEFVTIPISGAKGLQTISDLAKELRKRTTLDIKCSLHIHFGNLPTTRIFIVSLYKLASLIQNELFLMFPFYKTNSDGFKEKNYNKKLRTLDIMSMSPSMKKEEFNEYVNDYYKVIFSWLSEGYVPDQDINRKKRIHPISQKWNRKSRYYWLNFMNVFFSKRNTVEFRLHTPTTNQQKIVNWLFICNAIIKYVNKHASRILLSNEPISLSEVLSFYAEEFGSRGRFLSDYLIAYVEERKERFYQDYLKNDRLSNWEIDEDKTYEFKYQNTKHLF